jgi:hypothetical protein
MSELAEKNKGLWYNIHKKRKEGRPMRKPGSKGAPTDADFKSAQEDAPAGANTASIPNPTGTVAVDQRKRKEKPSLLKRFKRYSEE